MHCDSRKVDRADWVPLCICPSKMRPVPPEVHLAASSSGFSEAGENGESFSPKKQI